MKRLRKLSNNAGFSLAEMLMAILIMLMVSGIVATGIPAAKNAYEKVVIGANAQAMLSTAVAALRDELGTAWDAEVVDSGESVTYYKADTGAKAKLMLADGVISLQDFVTVDFIHDSTEASSAVTGSAHPLVLNSLSDLYVTYSTLQYDKTTGTVTVSGLKVCRKKDNAELANLGKDADDRNIDLIIRVLSASAVQEDA